MLDIVFFDWTYQQGVIKVDSEYSARLLENHAANQYFADESFVGYSTPIFFSPRAEDLAASNGSSFLKIFSYLQTISGSNISTPKPMVDPDGDPPRPPK